MIIFTGKMVNWSFYEGYQFNPEKLRHAAKSIAI